MKQMALFAVLIFALIQLNDIPAQSSKTLSPKPNPPAKTFGSGTAKPNPPAKTFGSGTAKPNPLAKTFGSGVAKTSPNPPAKTFGSGTAKPNPPAKTFGSGDKKPTVTTGPPKTYDSKAAQAQQKAESKAVFQKGKEPAKSYMDQKGNTVNIDPKDKKIESLRNQLSDEQWRNRELRHRNFYASYYNRPLVVYHDPYPSVFWYWMLDRSIEQQALWAYHHRYSMDSARYHDMLNKNAELAARVRVLESQNIPRNETYQPEGMSEPDLMYNDSYVEAAYNPQSHNYFNTLLTILVVLGIIALFVWLVFVKKW